MFPDLRKPKWLGVGLMISVVVCARVQGNGNPHANVFDLLTSAAENTAVCDQVEFLFKFDDDDPAAPDVIKKIDKVAKFPTKCMLSPARRGYRDLHTGYKEVYDRFVSPEAKMVGAMADDFLVTMSGWDRYLLSAFEQHPDGILFVHGRPHPPIKRPDYFSRKRNLDWRMDELSDLFVVDEAPFWGRALIDLCGGFGPVSFTDIWTLALQHVLWHRYRIDRTLFMPANFVFRWQHPDVDHVQSPRWSGDRKWNFEYIASEEFRQIIDQQADRIAQTLRSKAW